MCILVYRKAMIYRLFEYVFVTVPADHVGVYEGPLWAV